MPDSGVSADASKGDATSILRPPPADPFVRTDEPLLWLGGAGRESRDSAAYFHDAGARLDPPHVALQLTLGGTGFYQRGRDRRLLPRGWAFIDQIPGQFRYGYAPESRPGEAYELVFVSITGQTALRWLRRIHAAFGPVLDLGNDRAVTDMMLALSGRVDQRQRIDRYLASAQCYALLMELYSALTRSRLRLEPRVERAIALIEQHAGDARFNVEALAERLDCSREHLTRHFRRATGMTPSSYLTQQRMRLVAWALRRSDDKIEVIAHRCGFSGSNYLCRVFRQRWKLTPAQYRRSSVELLFD